MMPYWSWIASTALVALGAFYLVREDLLRRRNQGYWMLEEHDRTFYQRQFLRRFAGSSLLVIIGVGIFIGENLIDHNQSPQIFGWLWISLLLLVLCTVLLACLDLISIRHYAWRKRRELIAQHRHVARRKTPYTRTRHSRSVEDLSDWDPELN